MLKAAAGRGGGASFTSFLLPPSANIPWTSLSLPPNYLESICLSLPHHLYHKDILSNLLSPTLAPLQFLHTAATVVFLKYKSYRTIRPLKTIRVSLLLLEGTYSRFPALCLASCHLPCAHPVASSYFFKCPLLLPAIGPSLTLLFAWNTISQST